MDSNPGSRQGQATVEWIGLVLLLASVMVVFTVAGVKLPGAAMAHSVARSLLCAASLSGSCAGDGSLEGAYGDGLAGLVRAGAPTLFYGRDMLGLPVDYRTCRSPYCAEGPGKGEVGRSTAGERVTLFTRVIDCRPGGSEGSSTAEDGCAGGEGNIYVQYWAYYPESASLRGAPILEGKGYHPHDWESTQIRIGADGDISARASSHAGYNHGRSVGNWGSDMGWGFLAQAAESAGLRARGGWGEATGRYLIAGGSHAGNVADRSDAANYPSWTPAGLVRLVPLESVKDGPLSRPARFDPITPPWEKRVWGDPEAEGTG